MALRTPQSAERRLATRQVHSLVGMCGGLALAVASGAASAAIAPTAGYIAVPAALIASALLGLGALVPEIGVGLIIVTCTLWSTLTLNTLSVPFLSGGLKPLDILLILLLLGFVARRAFNTPPAKLCPPMITGLLLGLLGWSLLAVFRGLAAGYGKNALYELRALLHYLIFFPVVIEFSAKSVRRVIVAALTAAAVVSCRAVIDYRLGLGIPIGSPGDSILREMNFEFSYLVFALVLTAVLWCEKTSFPRPFLAVVAALSTAGLYVTFYRTAYVVLAAVWMLLVPLLTRMGRRRFIFGTIGTVLVGVIVAFPMLVMAPNLAKPFLLVTQRAETITNFENDKSAGHRLAESKAATAMILRQPIFGSGLGARVRFWSPMYDTKENQWGFWSDDFYMHNSFLWFATKMGIPSLLLFLGLCAAALWSGLRGLRVASGELDADDSRALLVGCMACLAAALLLGVLGPSLSTQGVSPFVGFSLGAICVLMRERIVGRGKGGRGGPV